MKNTSLIGVIALISASLITTAGCSGARTTHGVDVQATAKAAYNKRCSTAAAKRKAEEQYKRYLPPEVLMHRWAGKAEGQTGPQTLSEEALVDLLTEGRQRVILLVARGGTGKSKLAQSLQAQTCAKVRTAGIDLNWELAQHATHLAVQAASTMAPANAESAKSPAAATPNPILTIAAPKLGAMADETESFFTKELGNKRWLLILDSLDEVPLGKRAAVVGLINAAVKAHKNLHVLLMTRPPVYSGNYGLTVVDAFAELPQLTCARTDKALKAMVSNKKEQKALLEFTKSYGLARKVNSANGRCYYPHMATYRDFKVVRQLASRHSSSTKSIDLHQFASSRAGVYEFYLGALLTRDLKSVGITPKDALDVVDAMLLRHKPAAGDRNVRFGNADCVAELKAPEGVDKKAACERMLQSSLFETAGSKGAYKLRNQSIYDLFMARWIAAKIDASKDAPCKPLKTHAELFESNEIVGFLSGMSEGQRCLVPLAAQLCKRGGFAEHNYEQLDQGLPHGPDRKKLIDRAQNEAEKASEGPGNMCVDALLDRLYKTAK